MMGSETVLLAFFPQRHALMQEARACQALQDCAQAVVRALESAADFAVTVEDIRLASNEGDAVCPTR